MKPRFNQIKYFLIAVMSFLLIACGPTMPIVKTQYVVITPPDSLVGDCKIAVPPNKAEYLAMDTTAKEKALFQLSQDQFKNGFVCNNRLQQLRVWKDEQKDIYDAKNKEIEGSLK